MLTALLSILGVLVGALLHHWLSGVAQGRNRLLEARSKAYVDYVSANVKKTRSSTSLDETVLAEIDDAKYRICIYGSEEVLTALAAFEGSERDAPEPQRNDRFLNLCNAMRQDSGCISAVDSEILNTVIYGASEAGSPAKSGDA